VARLQHQRGGSGREPFVGTVGDDAAVDPAHDGDEPLGLEDAERLAQRRSGHAEALDEIGLVTQRLAVAELARHDQPAELVCDPLWLLARPGPVGGRLAGAHTFPHQVSSNPAYPAAATSSHFWR